ncbi:MAG: tRNA (adenosine(37)-N6)-threonylcarbamoyltransferase complex ATPase subunit type 1 TsaE [Patescibacteria group bacterium]
MKEVLRVITNNERETRGLGEFFAKEVLDFSSAKATVIGLEGDLGAGKTAFAKGFARGLGIQEEMKSPTFILMRAFRVPRKNKMFLHFDAYRIAGAKEFLQIGFKNLLKDSRNILFVEWADKVASILPKNRVKIRISHLKKDRREFIFYG